ncbi:unnamed protein product, partial [Nesidiocoris tenuis]
MKCNIFSKGHRNTSFKNHYKMLFKKVIDHNSLLWWRRTVGNVTSLRAVRPVVPPESVERTASVHRIPRIPAPIATVAARLLILQAGTRPSRVAGARVDGFSTLQGVIRQKKSLVTFGVLMETENDLGRIAVPEASLQVARHPLKRKTECAEFGSRFFRVVLRARIDEFSVWFLRASGNVAMNMDQDYTYRGPLFKYEKFKNVRPSHVPLVGSIFLDETDPSRLLSLRLLPFLPYHQPADSESFRVRADPVCVYRYCRIFNKIYQPVVCSSVFNASICMRKNLNQINFISTNLE